MAVTIVDVARHAGVSKSTVSNVIRGGGLVAEQTRSRVERSIDALGYRPDAVARALRERTSGVIALVVTDAMNPFYASLAAAVEQEATAAGLVTLVANTGCRAEAERRLLDTLVSRRVDGVVIGDLSIGSALPRELMDRDVPVVLAGCGTVDDPRAGAVDSDDESALDQVCAYLARSCHRHVAFLSTRDQSGARRETGFLEAAARHGIERVARDDPRRTAVFAHNDVVAIDELDVLLRAGVRVPEEVSVIGFDDVPLARHSRIDLTTVRCDAMEIGRRASRLLREAVAGHRHVGRVERVPAELMVRSTSGPAPQATPRRTP